jgi:CBS domain-containing protein
VALPAEQLPTARPEEPAAGLLARMVDAGAGVVLVTTGGDEVEGVVTVEDLERAAALPTTGRHP